MQTMMEMDADIDMDEMGADADPDEAPQQLPDEAGRIDVNFNYQAYTTEFDEIVQAEELCEPEELIRLRALLDQQLVSLQHTTSKLANRLQRRLMAKQNRTWEFDLDEGILDAGRLAQVVVDPMHPLAYKQEKEMEFRDTVVSMLIDSSGSMRGPIDHDRRHVRRHPRPDARAVFGTGGNSRLHHARLAGRAVPGSVDWRRQNRQRRGV